MAESSIIKCITNELVTSGCRVDYYHLKKALCFISLWTQEALLVTVVLDFVTSGIDYCNSILCSIANFNINRLQLIQNGATGVAKNTRKYDHIASVIKNKTVVDSYTFQDLLIFINLSMVGQLLPVRTCVFFKDILRYLYLNGSHMPIVRLM